MTKVRLLLFKLFLFLSFFAATPGVARSASPGFEVTPFVGYRGDIALEEQNSSGTTDINGGSSAGILANWSSGPTTEWELLYSLQQTDVQVSSLSKKIDIDVHTLHVGGIYLIPIEGEKHTKGFVGFTLGATRLDPSGFDSEDMFSFAFTGGVKFFPHQNIGIRLDGRAYGNVVSGSGAFLCNGGCVARIKGDLAFQLEGNLGLILRF